MRNPSRHPGSTNQIIDARLGFGDFSGGSADREQDDERAQRLEDLLRAGLKTQGELNHFLGDSSKEGLMPDPEVARNKANVAGFFEGVFNEGNMALIDQMIGPGYTYNGQPTTAAGTKQWAMGLRQAFPDLHFTVDEILGEGDKVAIRWTMVGTDPKTMQKMTTSGTNIITNNAQGQAIANWQNGGTMQSLAPVNPPSSGTTTAGK
jgi:predicted ester cyclase